MVRSSFHIAPGHEPYHVRVYHRFCRILCDAGYHVELAAQSRSTWVQPNTTVKMHFLAGDYALSYAMSPISRMKRVKEAYRLSLNSGSDIYTLHSFEFISHGIRLKRRAAKPVVFDCMEDFDAYARTREGIPRWFRTAIIRTTKQQLRRAAQNFDAIVTADPATSEYFVQFGGRARLLTLYNFPDLNLFSRPTSQPAKEFDLIYHGSFDRFLLQPILDIDDALVSRGKRLSWRLLGKCAVLDWLHGELSRRRAGNRFTITDSIPLEDVPSEVLKAQIGIVPLADLPKYRSNIPQKIFEFMALGIPFVLSDLPPSRPFTKDETCCLLAKPGCPESFAEAIIRLLDNPSLYGKMSEEGVSLARARYNSESEKGKLLDLYSELLGSTNLNN